MPIDLFKLQVAPDLFAAQEESELAGLLNLILGHSPDGIVLLNASGQVSLVNETAIQLLSSETTGIIISRPFPYQLSGLAPYELEVKNEGFESRHVALKTAEFTWKDQLHKVLAIRDITQRVRIREQLKSESTHDELTGLLNRRGFVFLGEQHILMANREKAGIFVIYGDLDNLKSINDIHGHKAGDEAIIQISTILRKTFRKSDLVARLGGDEFAILAIGRTASDEIIIRQRLANNISAKNNKRSSLFPLSLSLGFAFQDSASQAALDDLIEKADQRMYDEKKLRKEK